MALSLFAHMCLRVLVADLQFCKYLSFRDRLVFQKILTKVISNAVIEIFALDHTSILLTRFFFAPFLKSVATYVLTGVCLLGGCL